LWGQGVRRPTCKRLALLVAGLLETATVQRGKLTAAVARLRLSAAKEPRSRCARQRARRLERLLDDPQLDPERVVPLVQAEILPTLLAEVQAALPPALRDHVVLVADRGYGVSRMLDLAQALGRAWVLRLKGPTSLRLGDGRLVTAATLAPRPGAVAVHASTLDALCSDAADPDAAANAPVAAFRDAGWRRCRVVAAWAEGADEPRLLATTLSGSREEFLLYARRWAIERLFLHWKSHGWDLELLHAPTPARVGRLLTGMVLATLWTLAIAIAHTTTLLAAAAAAQRQPLQQPHLPGCEPIPRDPRPWPAQRSLFTWGRHVLNATVTALHTPAQCWAFPDWHTPTWPAFCQLHLT
jgi:hypothetical protein